MTTTPTDNRTKNTDILNSLFGGEIQTRGDWCQDELGPLLNAQLNAGVMAELTQIGSAGLKASRDDLRDLGAKTFRDVFAHSQSPPELLAVIKCYAKSLKNGDMGVFPAEVAQVIYLLSILCVPPSERQKVTTSDMKNVKRLQNWALAQGWIDEEIKKLIRNRK